MKIAGLQKTSLIEFPNHIVSIIFTQGCNFKCPYCHNSTLVPLKDEKDASYLPEDYLFHFLRQRKNLIDGLSITGGEPTLQPDLISFIRKIKDLHLQVKLDTNGTNPLILKKLLNYDLLDYIAMDIKAPLEKYAKIVGYGNTDKIKESLNIIMNADIDYEFRTTVVPNLHDSSDIKKIGILIKGAKNYYLQNFKPHNTLNPAFLKKSSFPPKVLKNFQEIVSPYIENVLIRD